MANPIKYTDLFQGGVKGKVDELAASLESLLGTFDRLADNARTKGESLRKALENTNPGVESDRAKIAELSKEIDALKKQIESLTAAKQRAAKASQTLKVANEEEIQARILARDASRQYTNQVKAEAAAMNLDEQTRRKLSNTAELQKMSYNELSQAYSQLVALANSMHASNQQEIKDRQEVIKMAGLVREEQKRLKEAMGNYTLSVGNYEKAFNGLDLAMQQVIRESPTITMGARMYFMAISNNLPILTEQIERVVQENNARRAAIETMKQQGATLSEIQREQAKVVPAIRQIVSSLFSWQTAMIIGITLLTRYGDKVVDWIASAFSAGEATRAWKEAQEDLNKTFDDAEVSAAKATAQADTLYKIATDETRSVEDRIKAGQILQDQYEDYFGNLSTEEIMLGKATTAHDRLTESLMNQAKARAYLDKITELYGKRIEAQAKVDEAQAFYDDRQARADAAMAAARGTSYGQGAYQNAGNWQAAANRAEKALQEAQQGVAVIDDEIQKLIDSMPVDGLMDMLVNGGGRGGKDQKVVDPITAAIDNLKYIRQAREAELNNIEDDTERELALTKFKYENELQDLRDFATQQQVIMVAIEQLEQEKAQATTIEKRNLIQEQINDLKRQWNITEDGVQAVNDLIVAKEVELTDKLAEIRSKRRDQLVSESQSLLKLQLELANKRAENDLEGDALDRQQTQNEIQYWTAMLASMEAFNDGSKEAAVRIEIVRETLRGLLQTVNEEQEGGGILEKFFGKDFNKFLRNLERALKLTANNIKEIIDLYHEQAKAAVEAAEAQIKAAEKVYDAELNAYENGYANNVEFARKEIALRRQQLAEAQAEEERYARMKERVDSMTQVSSMATAAAQLLKNFSAIPIVGQALAVAAIAAMFASFAAAKIQARQMAAQQYGEGGTEYIGYGGTHASGNDVDFGHMPDGRPRRIERGETVAVINARQTGRYGYPMLAEIIDSINKGEFVEKYMGAFSGGDGEFTMNMNNTFDSPYLSTISSDIKAIRKGGERSETVVGGTRITRYKNITRRIVS